MSFVFFYLSLPCFISILFAPPTSLVRSFPLCCRLVAFCLFVGLFFFFAPFFFSCVRIAYTQKRFPLHRNHVLQEGLKSFPSSGPSLPPTPFADRMNLEAELKALEKNFGTHLKDLGVWPRNKPLLGASSSSSALSAAQQSVAAAEKNGIGKQVAAHIFAFFLQDELKLQRFIKRELRLGLWT
jgi:hypothetical protein